jgi:16S rRNA (uracil1498-N3)-methyltransferase
VIIFHTDQIDNKRGVLYGDEANHCSRVLRKKAGDIITVINGSGFFFESKLISVDKNECQLEVIKNWQQTQPDYKIQIAISPLKSLPRFEWFIEKAVEIGIDTIVPIICLRTEKSNLKMSRLKNIVIAASKQTLKAKFTEILHPIDFESYVDSLAIDQAFIPHLNEETEYLGKLITSGLSYSVLIGPEGDFTDFEVSKAISKGIIPASLGGHRLRTETAGIVAGQIISTVNES